ncbi:MAG: CpsD/CapB family tyrosine-protein kinase [Paraglaciecola sp.]|uniref:CpsD/CapB family tyrosine-protein kinase n=1 Tax=Paraglaciecola sp. TaxID=1920173 RepID=UPI00329A77E0
MTIKNGKSDSIGELLVKEKKLSIGDISKIANEQKMSGSLFGDAAIKLGLLTKADIEQVLSEQFEFSYFDENSDKFSVKLITALKPDHPFSEKIRLLRVQLTLRWLKDKKSISIFGDDASVGTSLICANLAISFAQFGIKTLLVDANMRKPSQHELFKLTNTNGFSQILASRSGTEAIQNLPHFKNLSILTSGPLPPNPVELLGREEMQALVKTLDNSYDVVIYDCPSVKEHSDAYILTSLIKGVVITSKRNSSKLSNFENIVDKVNLSGGNLIGAVINEF